MILYLLSKQERFLVLLLKHITYCLITCVSYRNICQRSVSSSSYFPASMSPRSSLNWPDAVFNVDSRLDGFPGDFTGFIEAFNLFSRSVATCCKTSSSVISVMG